MLFSVEQRIIENKKTKQITSTYRVGVHVGEEDNMAILVNPTVAAKPAKSTYDPKHPDTDGAIDSRTTEEITSFLETFFRLYPKATQKELDYYVSKQVLKTINKDYVFSELVNPIYQKNDDKVKVFVYVKYLNQETKVEQLSQFEFTIEKSNNWYICE